MGSLAMPPEVHALTRSQDPLSASEPILVHVGYSKAASTWLQERLFRAPRHGFWALFPEKSDRLTLNRLLVYPSAFDAPAPGLQTLVRERVAARPDRRLVPVVSAEGLVGHEASPSGALARMLADRVVSAFPSPRILMIIREQVSMIRSNYLYYVRGGGRLSLRRYLDRPPIYETRAWTGFHLNYLEYDRLIAYYRSLVGPTNLCVLPLEMLSRDPAAFVHRIRDFAGVAVGDAQVDTGVVKPAIMTGGLGTRRILNHLFSIDEHNPFSFVLPEAVYWRVFAPAMRGYDRLLKVLGANDPAKLGRRIERTVGDHYAASNRHTAELIGLDLEVYGYRMKP